MLSYMSICKKEGSFMKKRYWVYISIVVVALLYVLCKHTILYVWANPYTDSKGIQSITPVVYRLNNILDKARRFSHDEGYDYKYSFFNLYGSGFMKNNPIPNDLDTEVSLYLGEYTYDGKNGDEIAQKLLEKIESFLFAFYYYVNIDGKDIKVTKSAFDQLSLSEETHQYNLGLISGALDNVVNKKNYVAFSPKVFELNKIIHKVDYPYSMGYNEILLTGAPSITLFSDKLSYFKTMKKYPREISLVTEYKFDLKYKDKVIETKIIPESYFGARLNINRRFFASSIFVNPYSAHFLNKESILTDPKLYYMYRMISYKRHIGEIETILDTDLKRTNKMFKRFMQTADMIQPLLDKDLYNEISDFVYENLADRDMQLLNEYENIGFMLKKLEKHPGLFMGYIKNGTLQKMYNLAEETLEELYNRGNIDKKYLDVVKEFQNTRFKRFLISEVKNDLPEYDTEDKTYDILSDALGGAMISRIIGAEKIDKYVSAFKEIFTKAGYHKFQLYWLDNRTLGYVEDDFSRNIKDMDKFIKENELADFNYKMIKESEIPEVTLRYDLWVRNNPTSEEEKYYKQMRQVLEEDRKNFKVKRKLGFAFVR